MENDAKTIDRLNTEKSQILGQIVELRAKITSLEGQVGKNIRIIDSGHSVMLLFDHSPRETIFFQNMKMNGSFPYGSKDDLIGVQS